MLNFTVSSGIIILELLLCLLILGFHGDALAKIIHVRLDNSGKRREGHMMRE